MAQMITEQRNEGEGSKSAARAYNRGAAKMAANRKEVEKLAREAAEALDGEEAEELRAAEERAKAPAAEEDPALYDELEDMPLAMRDLDPDVHRKAVERANELMELGYDNQRAMRIGVALALEWADNGKSSQTEATGPALHVMFERSEWLVLPDDNSDPAGRFNNLEDALRRAHQLATGYSSAVYVHDPEGALIDKFENYSTSATASPERQSFHVLPYQDQWAVSCMGGQEGWFEEFETKEEAIAHARECAREACGELIVHTESGDIARTHSYA